MSESRAPYETGEEVENWPEMMVPELPEVESVARCGACGMVLSSWAEYHSIEFCVLYQAGYKPWDFVREAAKYLEGSNA